MKTAWVSRLIYAALVAAVFALPATASACAVCMGDPSTKTAGAINGAIFLMLGFVALMLCTVVAFAFYLMARANSPVPPQTEIASMINDPEDSK